MVMRPVLLALVLSLSACDPPIEPCGDGGACALPISTLVVTGQVRASVNPLSGVLVTITAHQGTCDGPEIRLVPSPVSSLTDSLGRYRAQGDPAHASSNACVRVAVSDALYTDTSGVVLHRSTRSQDSLHIDVTAP